MPNDIFTAKQNAEIYFVLKTDVMSGLLSITIFIKAQCLSGCPVKIYLFRVTLENRSLSKI